MESVPNQYEYRVVLFLDILGFKKHVELTVDKDDVDQSDQIVRIHRTLSSMGSTALTFGSGNKRRVTQFSDSIVISFDGADKSMIHDTFRVCLKIWVDLLMDRIICRGALSSGKLIHTDNILFGPALVDAYETESEAAMYPRIIMDRSLYKYGRAYTENDRVVFPKGMSNLVDADHDGKYYLDFLHGALYVIEDKTRLKEYFETLREVIINGSKFQQPSLKVKYGYLKYKYNTFLQDMRGMGHPIHELYGDELMNYLVNLKYLSNY